MSRICRKCLMGQQAEDHLALIEKNIRATPEKHRAAQEEYDRRVGICEECEKRNGATCMGCGCFVELRAIRKDSHCPYKKW